jgi:hypothetical protein
MTRLTHTHRHGAFTALRLEKMTDAIDERGDC